MYLQRYTHTHTPISSVKMEMAMDDDDDDRSSFGAVWERTLCENKVNQCEPAIATIRNASHRCCVSFHVEMELNNRAC